MKSFDSTSISPHELLRALVENTAAAIFVKDLDGRYVSVNRTCEQLWGLTRSEIIGKSDYEMLPAASADQVRANDQQVMDSGRPEQFEEIIDFPAGTRVFLSSKSPLYAESGEPRGICGISTDITARYEYRSQLHQSEDQLRAQARELAELHERKDKFLAVLAHELRNPLAPIRHAAELISSPRARDEQIGAAVAVIGRQVSHMARLIDDLMDAARLTRGRIELRTADMAIASVFERACEMVDSEMRQRGHTLDLSVSDGLVVHGDPERLVQIVGNLLENAVRYSERPGTIWLEGRQQGKTARIVVRDEGRGIAAEKIDYLFEPFSRDGVPHQSASSGLGLGLVIVKQLVDLHGGTIRVESDGPGQGCQFIVELPLAEAQPVAAAEEDLAKVAVNARRILVVDDNQDAAELMAELLAMDGHDVTVCFRGQEVAESVRKSGADTVLLDIGLPDLDGYRVAEQLRAEHGSVVQLIAVTGYGQDGDRERSRQAGFDHHMVKPMDFASLRKLLDDRNVPDR